MGAISNDFRRQITGRGNTFQPYRGNDRTPIGRLFRMFRTPNIQNSLLVYEDGTVLEGQDFRTDQIEEAAYYIQGGHDHRCEGTGWLHDTLETAGYPCSYAEGDIYTDVYTDEYPLLEGA